LKQKISSTKSIRNFVFTRGLSFLILLLFNANFYAQKIIKKSLITKASNFICEFDIVDEIVIYESLRSNEVTVSAECDESIVPNFILEEKNGNVFIKSIEVKFDQEVGPNKVCKIQPIYSSFKIMIPKGKNVLINYVDGNFYLNNFDGNLKLNLNDGIVNIDPFLGSVSIKLNGGNVYCKKIQNTKIDINSNLGIVSSSLSLEKSIKKNNQLKGTYGRKLNELNVNAITANIHLK
jgi:hypothetical protein